MKKLIVLLLTFTMFCTGICVAAATKVSTQVTNIRVVQAAKDTTVTYSGVKIFVPAGQTIMLAHTSNGDVILRGNNLKKIKVQERVLFSNGTALLSVQPKTQVLTLLQGEHVTVLDKQGNALILPRGGAISTNDVSSTVILSPSGTKPATVAAQSAPKQAEIPFFVAESTISSTVSEQAVQDAEETLSPSAPH